MPLAFVPFPAYISILLSLVQLGSSRLVSRYPYNFSNRIPDNYPQHTLNQVPSTYHPLSHIPIPAKTFTYSNSTLAYTHLSLTPLLTTSSISLILSQFRISSNRHGSLTSTTSFLNPQNNSLGKTSFTNSNGLNPAAASSQGNPHVTKRTCAIAACRSGSSLRTQSKHLRDVK